MTQLSLLKILISNIQINISERNKRRQVNNKKNLQEESLYLETRGADRVNYEFNLEW